MDEKEFVRLLAKHLDKKLVASEWMATFLSQWTIAIGEVLGVIAAAQREGETRTEQAESIAHRLELAQKDPRLNDYGKELAKIASETMYRELPRDFLEKLADR